MRHPFSLISFIMLFAACGGPETNFSEINPEIVVVPTDALTFEPVIVGQTGVAEVFISNAGKAPLELFEVSLQDSEGVFDFGIEVPTEVEKEGTIAVPVTFTPKNFLDYSGSITIVSDDEDFPEIVLAITGTGVDAPKPDICLDSLALDFGVVPQDSTAFEFIEIENCGTAPLELGTLGQTGSGAFSIESNPTFTTIAPGNRLPVVVTYTPYSDVGDNGSITIPSNDPDEPEVSVVLLGNGGGDLEYPVAVVECPAVANPPGFAVVDGSGSYDPNEQYPLRYEWTLVATPVGSEARFTNPTGEVTELQMDLAGSYAPQLVVYNAADIPSAPTLCPIVGEPADAIHIELTWDTPSADLDLHLVENDGAIFEKPGDCTWCNRTPSWGAGGSSDDPRLDLDDVGGFGPENINVFSPADGRYHVKVHYFEDHGDFAVTARAKIWLAGTVAWEGSKVLTRNQIWNVGQVNWPEADFAPDPGPLQNAGGVRECFTP
ncbi:MAG: hypothetical protein ACI8PZ_000445 [Myxococcota bacterium]|jgi:hypothetical protein